MTTTAYQPIGHRRMYGLGRRINHDPASKGYPASMGRVRDVVHRHQGPVLDQGQLGSCTGNAAAQVMNFDHYRWPADRPLLTEDDAVQLYSWATHHDTVPGYYPPTDTGSSGLAVARALKHESRIRQYRHAFGVTHTLGAVALGPVIVGTAWTEAMFTPGPTGFVRPDGDVVGGHEWVIYGIDTATHSVRALNSWGEGWGVADDVAGIPGGTFRITWADLGALLADQGDCTVFTL